MSLENVTTEDYDDAFYLSNQVEQAKRRAVLAASDAGVARDRAASAEQSANEAAKRAERYAKENGEVSQKAVVEAEAAKEAAREAASLVGAPADTVIATALSSEGTATNIALSSALSGKADLQAGKVPEAQIPDRLSDSSLKSAIDLRVPVVDIKRFGAVGDGVTNDTAAVQSFFDYLGSNGGQGTASGTFKVTNTIAISQPARPFAFTGSRGGTNLLSSASGAALHIRGLSGGTISGLTIDGGRSDNMLASHGISATNCDNTVFRDIDVKNYGDTAIMVMFAPAYFKPSVNNRIVNCNADGGGLANNGFMLESSQDSSIENCNVYNLNPIGDPSYGLQIKNGSTRCSIIGGSVDGAVAGVAFGNTTGDFAADCIVDSVRVSNVKFGAILGYAKKNKISIKADLNSAAGASSAFRLNAECEENEVEVVASNIPSGAHAVYILGVNNHVRISTLTNCVGQILGLGSGASRNSIWLGKWSEQTTSANPLTKVSDASGKTDNYFSYEHNLSELESLTASGVSKIKFPRSNSRATSFEYRHSSSSFTWLPEGAAKMVLTGGALYPFVSKGLTLGTTTRGWDNVYLSSPNGTVFKVSVSDTGVLSATAI